MNAGAKKVITAKGSAMMSREVETWVADCEDLTDAFMAARGATEPRDTGTLTPILGSPLDTFLATHSHAGFATEMWAEHLDALRRAFCADPHRLFDQDLVRYAIYLSVAGEYVKSQLPYLEARYAKDRLVDLLTENASIRPSIVHPVYGTSESRVIHLTHLTYGAEVLGLDLTSIDSLIEFGGGYGSMTDAARRLSPGSTQVVIDFPIMLAIQIYYLLDRYGADEMHVIRRPGDAPEAGKINFCPIGLAESLDMPGADLFTATWSLSEANALTHEVIANRCDFYQASHLLYGYRRYEALNPRQPCSAPLDLGDRYRVVEDAPVFWALEREHHYQLAHRREGAS